MQYELKQEKNYRRKILVVDDELINRCLLGNIISEEFNVLYAENGVEAMKLIEENERTLSLIMLDLLMPEKDGYEVLTELQNSPELKRIPVIVLTSEKSAEVKSLRLGAADFISKPYDMPEVILARVKRSIELAESYMMFNRTEHDSLTGLYNREFFMEYCDRYDNFHPDSEMDAVVININKFHILNELYGRSHGDKLLKQTAGCIREVLEKNEGLACRNGGDVFLLYLPHQSNYAAFSADFEKRLRECSDNSGITVRVGVYENADREIEIERRFDRAVMALGNSKDSYKTTFSIYDTVVHEKELYDERLIHDISKAISEKQFKVYYQPKYDIRGDTPRLTSAEALIRWVHPELGMISPGRFIPLFEKNGLIQKLDHYVWNEAAAQIRKNRDEFGKRVPVSVNVSRIDIYDPELESTLLEIVSKNDLEHADLLLEITESAYTDNSSQIVQTVEKA